MRQENMTHNDDKINQLKLAKKKTDDEVSRQGHKTITITAFHMFKNLE